MGGMLQGAMGQIWDVNRANQQATQNARMMDLIGGALGGRGGGWGGGGWGPTAQYGPNSLAAAARPGYAGPPGGAPMNLQSQFQLSPYFPGNAYANIQAGQNQMAGAAGNIAQSVMPGASQAAFAQHGIPSVGYTVGGRQVGGMQVGAAPGTTPMGGMPQGSISGMQITPTQFWGAPQSQALQSRLSQITSAIAPYLQGPNQGMVNNFRNFMGGLAGKIGSNLDRQGYQAQAQHNLEAAREGINQYGDLWRVLSQLYGNMLDESTNQRTAALNQLRYLV
jgi:hypothetical protein